MSAPPSQASPPAPPSPEASTAHGKRISLTSLLRVAVLSASLCVVIAALRAASSVLAPVVGALFFALIVVSPVPWLCRLVPRAVAGLLVGLGAVGFLVVIGALVPRWTAELSQLLAAHADELYALPTMMHDLAYRHGLVGPKVVLPTLPTEWMLELSGAAFRLTASVLSAIVFLGFILAELAGLHAKLAVAFGPDDRRIVMVRRVWTRLTVYFRVKTIASLVTGIVAAVGCALVGVDLALLWGLVAFLLNYAPTVGSLVAAIPPILLAALTLGWEHAAVLSGIYLAVNGAIGGVIEPKILGQRMGLSPLVVLVSLIFWGWVWGPIGLLLAVPMTMVLKIVMEQTEELRPLAVLLGSAGSAQTQPEARAARAAPRRSEPPWPQRASMPPRPFRPAVDEPRARRRTTLPCVPCPLEDPDPPVPPARPTRRRGRSRRRPRRTSARPSAAATPPLRPPRRVTRASPSRPSAPTRPSARSRSSARSRARRTRAW